MVVICEEFVNFIFLYFPEIPPLSISHITDITILLHPFWLLCIQCRTPATGHPTYKTAVSGIKPFAIGQISMIWICN